jgi:hypothetical protein
MVLEKKCSNHPGYVYSAMKYLQKITNANEFDDDSPSSLKASHVYFPSKSIVTRFIFKFQSDLSDGSST